MNTPRLVEQVKHDVISPFVPEGGYRCALRAVAVPFELVAVHL